MKIQRLEEATGVPDFREYTEGEIKEAYALARAAFSADDLQRFTEIGNDVSADEVLAIMEETQNQIDRGRE